MKRTRLDGHVGRREKRSELREVFESEPVSLVIKNGNHSTLYTTTLPTHSFLSVSTLYCVSTNTSTTNTTWPSSSIVYPFAAFSTNRNHSLIHIHFHTFTVYSILHLLSFQLVLLCFLLLQPNHLHTVTPKARHL